MLTVIFVSLLVFLTSILACLCSIREILIETKSIVEWCQRNVSIIRMKMIIDELKKGDSNDEP